MLRTFLCLLILLLALPLSAKAHKANFFAYVENGTVFCEGGFPGGKACKECPIIVKNAATGEEMMRITSNNVGFANFPVDEKVKQAKHGLKLILWGGEGHQAEWLLDPEEYLTVAANPAATPVPAKAPAAATPPSQTSLKAEQLAEVQQRVASAVSAQELQAAVAEALQTHLPPMLDAQLEAKIGPLRRQMAKAQESGPTFVSIMGGLGWIIGLGGIITWFRAKQKS